MRTTLLLGIVFLVNLPVIAEEFTTEYLEARRTCHLSCSILTEGLNGLIPRELMSGAQGTEVVSSFTMDGQPVSRDAVIGLTNLQNGYYRCLGDVSILASRLGERQVDSQDVPGRFPEEWNRCLSLVERSPNPVLRVPSFTIGANGCTTEEAIPRIRAYCKLAPPPTRWPEPVKETRQMTWGSDPKQTFQLQQYQQAIQSIYGPTPFHNQFETIK